MVSIELQPEDLEKPNQETFKRPESVTREDSLDANVEEIDLPFLTQESLSNVFDLYEFKVKYIEQLSIDELFDFMGRIQAFEEKLKTKADNGEIMFGDNVIEQSDLSKFALYNVLVGKNMTPEVIWLDLEDGLIEKFMRNGFSE